MYPKPSEELQRRPEGLPNYASVPEEDEIKAQGSFFDQGTKLFDYTPGSEVDKSEWVSDDHPFHGEPV